MNMKKNTMRGTAALLLLLFLAGCAADQPATGNQTESGKRWNISEDFERVTQDFSRHYGAYDEDGFRYDQALAAVGDYLEGTGDRQTAETALQDTIDAYQQSIDQIQPFSADEALTRSLQACGISVEEYEMFVNSRAQNIDSNQTSLITLLYLIQIMDVDPEASTDLAFLYELDTAEQECMRGYYYYGSLNYWFAGAREEELDYLQTEIIPNFRSYIIENDLWYDDREAVEDRVADYLDQLLDIGLQMAQHVGQAQADLYEMEQDYQQALDDEALLERLLEISQRLEELSEEIAQTNDGERLAELEVEFYRLVAEYEALTGEKIE